MTDKNDKKKADEELSAYEKAALSGDDPRCVPIKLDADAPEGNKIVYPDYSAAENETWKTLFARHHAKSINRPVGLQYTYFSGEF